MYCRSHDLPATGGEKTRLCCHAASGRTLAPKICIRNRECFHCSFDQWLDHCDEEKHPVESRGVLAADHHRLAA